MSNLSINVAGKVGTCQYGEFWAASQAAPMRRVDVNGSVTLMDYCSGCVERERRVHRRLAALEQRLSTAPQQQYLVRNSSVGGWIERGLESGLRRRAGRAAAVVPEPAVHHSRHDPGVTREAVPLRRLGQALQRLRPRRAAQLVRARPGQTGQTPGHSLPIESFFIARPTDSAQTINAALVQGKNLIFTPGIYNIDRTIEVKRADTVVLGLGMATLDAPNGVVPLTVGDVPGRRDLRAHLRRGPGQLAALLLAGLAAAGPRPARATRTTRRRSHDVFFRIGGPHVGKATVSLVVNSDNVILDDIWAWRADHGTGVGWTSNTADTGVVVNGDNVTATGLFVEHYQKYNVLWNGENGKTIMFQNELPYDPPNQAAWQHDGVLGWAAYKVADSVKTHEAWGLGSYCFFWEPDDPREPQPSRYRSPRA